MYIQTYRIFLAASNLMIPSMEMMIQMLLNVRDIDVL